MACSGNYCASFCYSHGCGRHRAARPSYTYSFPAVSDRPTAAFTNALRAAMNQELAERGSSRRVISGTVTSQNTKLAKFDNGQEILTDLKNCINSLSAGYVTATYTGKIAEWHFTDIRDKIQTLMRDCVCAAECSGNNWCSCYGDCSCFYSSITLKYTNKNNTSFIDRFNKIPSKEWKYTLDPTDTLHYGPIAEDVEQQFPSVIKHDSEGLKMINLPDLVGILWDVVQHQQKEIEKLKENLSK